MKILFVCTGNTCRSPMAAALASALYPTLETYSAGLSVWDAAPANEHAVTVMREAGLDISGHAAQPVTAELIAAADWTLTMTRSHKQALHRMFPKYKQKICTLCEYTHQPGDVPDPFGMALSAYQACADTLRALLVHLKTDD